MSKSLVKSFLLILLSITLPLQAAVAASKGGCLRHGPHSQGPERVALDGGHGHGHSDSRSPRSNANDGQHPVVGHFSNHHASLKKSAVPTQRAAQPAAAAESHTTSTSGDAACPHHVAADAPASSPEPDCTSCGWCCMGTALPSQSLRWLASLAQLAPTPTRAWAHVSPPLRALERPPRAPLSAT